MKARGSLNQIGKEKGKKRKKKKKKLMKALNHFQRRFFSPYGNATLKTLGSMSVTTIS